MEKKAKKAVKTNSVIKTRDLFGERNVETIDFILPPKKQLAAVSQLLDRLYSKMDLVNIYSAFRKWTEGYMFRLVDDDGLSANQTIVTALLSKATQKYKDTYADFLGVIFADSRNLAIYFKYMPEKSRNLFREIIIRGCMTMKEAKTKGGISRRSGGYSYYYDSDLDGEFAWLTVTNFGYYSYSSDEANYYVYLRSSMCKYFIQYLIPEVYETVKTVPELEGEGWEISNFEANVFRDVPLVEGMFSQGVIEPGKSKLMTAATEKKIDLIGMADFHMPESTSAIRGRMIATYIAYMLQCNEAGFDGVSLPVEDQACNMVRTFPTDDAGWFQICTPFISGIRRSVVQASNARDILRYVVSALFTFGGNGGWVPVTGIFEHMYANLLSNGNRTFAFEPDRFNMGSLPDNMFSMQTMKPDKIIYGFSYPLVRGFLCLLASWGLLETAVKTDVKCKDSPYDGLQYVRVTALGRYALGLDKEYKAPKIEKKVWFELDDERLIFRSLSEDNPYIVILKDVSNSIGGGRYEVTAESFLSHCSTRADVEQKIDIFKQYIGRELPQVWKDFFAEMLRHCQPLEKLPITNYKMYRVAKDNMTLQRLLTTDEKLRSLVIRAEGYRIIVAKADMTKFENRLKSFGYLL